MKFDIRKIGTIVIIALFPVLLWSTPVFALPTPDALVNVFQVFPVIMSTLIGLLTGLGVYLKKHFSELKDPVGSLLKTSIILFICLIVSLMALTYNIAQNSNSDRLKNLEMYFRSDISLDQLEMEAVEQQDYWFSSGTVSHLSFDELANFSEYSEDPILIDLGRVKLRHDSGFLAIPYKGTLKKFVFIYPPELYNYLQNIIKSDKNSHKRPLIFYNWDNFTIWRSFSRFGNLKELLQEFDQVYALPRVLMSDVEKLNNTNNFIKICTINPETGQIEETDRIKGIVQYPVRNEGMVFNEKFGAYPNLLKLIPTMQFLNIIGDSEVQIVAPFNSLYRTRKVYEYFIRRYLKSIDLGRIRYIDFNSTEISKELIALSHDLKDKKFVTIGLTKQDWIYMGVDIAHNVWTEYGRNDPSSFKFIGSTVQMAEIAAVLISKQSSFTERAKRKLHKVFNALLTLISETINVPVSFAILILAVVFRLILFPVGYLETRSRLIRSDLDRFIKLKLGNNSDFYFLTRYKDLTAKLLGCNKALEVIGGIISLMLILPFFPIITNINWDNSGSTFLWINDISHPSQSLTVILILVIFLKLVLSRISLFHKGLKKTDLLLLIFLFLFYVLLSKIQSSVIVFAIGVIGTQLIIDIYVRVTTMKTVRDSMILMKLENTSLSNNPSFSDESEKELVLSLQESAYRGYVGNKGRRLGELLNDCSKLFIVPNGIVLTPAGVRLAISGLPDFENQLFPEMNKILPGLDTGRFAVRSCGLSEDSSQNSLAGKYETILNVDSKGMWNAICDVSNSFDKSDRVYCSIIIQQMADVDIAGVLFTASPENRKLSIIEYSKGLAVSLVSGETTPIQVNIGNFSGTVQENKIPSHGISFFKGKKEKTFYQRLFLTGKLIEEKFGCPQDIEWGYNCKNETLSIIQSRDITAFVDDKVITDEQSRLLLKVAKTKAKKSNKWIWGYSDIIEVVDKPSPFTLSLLSGLYSNSGSQGIANRHLGFSVPSNQESMIESVFGSIYNNNLTLNDNNHLFNKIKAVLLLKKKLKKDPYTNFIHPITQRLDEFKNAVQIDIHNNGAKRFPNDPGEIFTLLSDKLNFFCREYYAVAYETTILTNFANKYLLNNTENIGNMDESFLSTKTTELFIALSELNRSKDIDKFIKKWGHRSLNDYDLARPSFSERPEDALSYASKFAGFDRSKNMAYSGNNKKNSLDYRLKTYHQFVVLKERAKDESLYYLRSIKPLFIHLADVLQVSPEIVFNFYLSEIHVPTKYLNENSIAELLQASKARHLNLEKLRQIEFKDLISIENIEFLSKESISNGDHHNNITMPEKSGMVGTMVSVPNSFEGRLKFIFNKEDYNKELKPGDILVTRHLNPELVALFSKVSGCISEKGGRLSHAAIVAREMNFPVLVGIQLDSSGFSEDQNVRVTEEGKIEIS